MTLRELTPGADEARGRLGVPNKAIRMEAHWLVGRVPSRGELRIIL